MRIRTLLTTQSLKHSCLNRRKEEKEAEEAAEAAVEEEEGPGQD